MSATDLWPYLALILVGFLPNEVWRWLGLLAARGLDEDSQILSRPRPACWPRSR
jgi:hypothetical protein